jgi:hypothetical protein
LSLEPSSNQVGRVFGLGIASDISAQSFGNCDFGRLGGRYTRDFSALRTHTQRRPCSSGAGSTNVFVSRSREKISETLPGPDQVAKKSSPTSWN